MTAETNPTSSTPTSSTPTNHPTANLTTVREPKQPTKPRQLTKPKQPKPLKIGEVIVHGGCFIMYVDGGYDVVARRTGGLHRFPTERAAKWNATVWTRLADAFGV